MSQACHPSTDGGVVVGAAIVRAGRVLAALRSTGGWEFPGGKVEIGETDALALVRECREELGVAIAVGALLGESTLPGGHWVLRVHLAELTAGEPRPLDDHDALRWLAGQELDDVAWLPGDRQLLAALRPHLVSRE